MDRNFLNVYIINFALFKVYIIKNRGKTTTISMITGMFPPTEGNAWIAGYDIINQME